jgi:hypothetical protein
MVPSPFAHRPQNPLFRRRIGNIPLENAQTLPPPADPAMEEIVEDTGFKHFSLMPREGEATSASARHGAVPVGPLAHARGFAPGGRTDGRNALGQSIPVDRPTPVVSPPPSNVTSQETAVNTFKRANRGLPDGVRYEPLDEETMRLLKEHGHIDDTSAALPEPVITPQVESVPVSSPAPVAAPSASVLFTAADPALADRFKRLAQDERNAHIFYTNLSVLAPETTDALDGLAQEAARRVGIYTELLDKRFGLPFAPEDAPINTQISLADGIQLALSEENKSLGVLSDLLDETQDTHMAKTLQSVINRKVIGLSALRSI